MRGRNVDLTSPIFEGLLTFEQAAQAADCTVRTIENLAARGMPVHRFGILRFVDPQKTREWLTRDSKPETGVRRGRPRKVLGR